MGVIVPSVLAYVSDLPPLVTYAIVLACATLGIAIGRAARDWWDQGAEVKIRQWADRFGQPIKREINPQTIMPDAKFAYHITNEQIKTTITVCQPQDGDQLFFLAWVKANPDVIARFNKLSVVERMRTVHQIKLDLLKLGIGFSVEQDEATGAITSAPMLQHSCVYSKSMHHTDFYDNCDQLGRAVALTRGHLFGASIEEKVAKSKSLGQLAASPPVASLPDSERESSDDIPGKGDRKSE